MRKYFSGSAFARECPYSSGIHRRAAVFFAFCAVAFTLLYLRVGYPFPVAGSGADGPAEVIAAREELHKISWDLDRGQ